MDEKFNMFMETNVRISADLKSNQRLFDRE